MKNYLLVLIALGFLENSSRAVNPAALIDVAMGYSSSDDDHDFYIFTTNSATNSYFCSLVGNKNGTPAAAKYMVHNLLKNVIKKYHDSGEWQDALKQGLVITNQNFSTMFRNNETASGTIVSIRNGKIIVTQVGNASAILINRRKPLPLTSSKTQSPGEPSVQIVPLRAGLSCVLIATAEFWQRRDIGKTTAFCLDYLDGLGLNTIADLQTGASDIANGLVNSVIRNLNEDQKLAIRVMVILIKSS